MGKRSFEETELNRLDTRLETQQIDTFYQSSSAPLVLVTDDNPQARMLLRRILEREGYRVEEAHDGKTALKKAFDLAPDLILMDVQMPDMDGFETVRTLRQNPRMANIPIIVVTAAAREPSDITKGFGLGADDYLLKPFNAIELLARANAKIRARRLEDKVQRRTEELEMLLQVGTVLNQQLALESIADRLLAAVHGYLPTEFAALIILDDEGHPILHRLHGLELPLSALMTPESFIPQIIEMGEAIIIRDTETIERGLVIFPDTDCHSAIIATFRNQGRTSGALVLGDSKANRFSASNLRVLRSVAEQAALAISNAQLFEKLQAYAQNLEGMVEARTQALHAARQQLIRADKLAALGTMAAGIAHEVGNPLQPLLTNLEMTLEDIDAGRAVDRELVDLATGDVKRIKRLISRLLDFARPASPDHSLIDLNEILHDVLSLANKQLEHSKVKVHYAPGEIVSITGNPDQLKQVFLNLIVNAMDAMPKGGELRIETQTRSAFVALVVEDTGMGIPQEKLHLIFDPFFTTKTHGTGLGLSVSYGIIEGHGGQISVESELNRFTRFTILLPQSQE